MKGHTIYNTLMLTGILSFSTVAMGANWFPLEVEQIASDGSTKMVPYQGVDKAAQPWKLCAALPHLKDPFWMATDYGMAEEAKRIGVNLQVMDAGGYPNLSNQISQIENCVAGGAQAVVLGAVSHDGLNNLLIELKKKQIPVVDMLIGVSSEDVGSHVLASPYAEGYNSGQFLVQRHPKGSTPVKVAWLPGPAGTGFVEQFDKGFKDGIKGGAIDIVETKHGDLGKEVQARLVEDVLQTHKNLDYIVGSGVTAEAGVPILRAHNKLGKTKLIALYMTPGVYNGIKQKTIEAAYMERGVISARISINQAVKLLEKQDVIRTLVVKGHYYDQSTIKDADTDQAFAPAGFRPIFKVEAK